MLFNVLTSFSDGDDQVHTDLGHQDLCALVETFDNLPSLFVCIIWRSDVNILQRPVVTMEDRGAQDVKEAVEHLIDKEREGR